LGLSLVQGNDLTVRENKLYLKTLQGLQPVHGLLKRVDDDWLDPLEMRADSTLGVPGLLQAVRSGHVLVANTPGSGFLESNALLGFMPALARDLMGEALQLPSIPSWWCGEAAALQDVLPRMHQCIRQFFVHMALAGQAQHQGTAQAQQVFPQLLQLDAFAFEVGFAGALVTFGFAFQGEIFLAAFGHELTFDEVAFFGFACHVVWVCIRGCKLHHLGQVS
jgi:hypothetical protein